MNKDDQRITAYALGELRGAERDAFEADLAASEDLQREFKETLEMIEKIGNLPAPEEGLSDEQRVALRDECQKNLKIVRHNFRTRRMIVVGMVGTMAACLLIALMVLKTPEQPPGSVPMAAGAKFDSGAVVTQANVEGQELAIALPTPAPVPGSPAQPVTTAPLEVITASKVAQKDGLHATLAVAASSGVSANSLDAMTLQDSPPKSVAMAAPAAMPAPVADMAMAPAAPMTREQTAQIRAFTGGSATVVQGERGSASLAKTDKAEGGARRYVSSWDDVDSSFGLRTAQPAPGGGYNTEAYSAITENSFLTSKENPLSTFSIDVDTASYSNVRRFLQAEQLPPPGAVRIEELINYFPYAYPQPEGKVPFSVNVEVAQAPWDTQHQLARIALKGREVAIENLPPSNLVFLIDVSGSMDEPAKLPLLKRSLQALVEHVRPQDRVAIVVYAGNSGLVLPSTSGKDQTRILEAIERLKAGGSTNGGEGIKLAYKTARENFVKEGSNRVILCTDGDFNVGTTSDSELVKLIEKERESGVFLSVLGFGTGNLKDSKMMNLADKGNGNYAYIDSLSEGRKVLVEQMGGTLFTIAKDVKIQVEFNPAKVAGYRLIGYEKRLLAKEDFNNDRKDAGEIGSGHTVTALYEIVPAGMALPDRPSVDPLKYQTPPAVTLGPPADVDRKSEKVSDELFTVKLRYKAPDGEKSELIEVPVASAADKEFEKGSEDFQFAAAVAAFGMKLRDSKYVGDISWSEIQRIARRSLGEDAGSYRAEFLTLVEKASKLREFKEEEAALQTGKALGIVDCKISDLKDGAKRLLISLKAQSGTHLSTQNVQIRVFVYEIGNDGEVSLANVKSRWLSEPVDWAHNQPEILAVEYQPISDTGGQRKIFYGFVVSVYLDKELQSYRAEPAKLVSDFPIPILLK
ncbi:hypothetical protein BH09VER1_BH09VER1_35750 [soil metagenome]